MIDGPGESKGEGDAEHAAHRIGSRPSAEIEGCTERTGRSASPCASLADSTRGMPRNRDGRPAMKAEPPNSESADGSDDSAIHQRKGLPTSQVPLAVNERAKRLTKSQPSRVTSSRRSTAIIVNYSDLRWAKGGLFDTEPGGKTRNSRRGGETRHHSRLTCERSEPITLELAAADLGSDSEDFPPATGIDPNRINLLIDSHEGLGTHVKTNQKVQAEGGIAVLVTQLGSNFDETGIEGWLTFGIKHLNTLPIRRVRAWCEWVWSFTMPSRWHIAPAIATRLQDRRRIRVAPVDAAGYRAGPRAKVKIDPIEPEQRDQNRVWALPPAPWSIFGVFVVYFLLAIGFRWSRSSPAVLPDRLVQPHLTLDNWRSVFSDRRAMNGLKGAFLH